MSTQRDAYDVTYCAPPPKELPPAEKARRNQQAVFHSEAVERGRQVGYQATATEAEGICVLDERGNHKRVSPYCPHGLLDADFETVTVIEF